MNKINRSFYQLVSLVFHPLLMILYLLFMMAAINPYDFTAFQGEQKHLLIFQVVVSTVLLPGIAIVMMYSLGMVSSVELGDRKERMFPFIAVAVFYLWLFANFVYNPGIPRMLNVVLFASILAVFLAMVINLFIRLSVHCMAMGAVLSSVVLLYWDWTQLYSREIAWSSESMFYLILLCIICAGLVGTARLQLKVHSTSEVYTGYMIGFISPFMAYFLIDLIFYG
jgi:membrane-associated phospholipid phosphatase